MVEITAHEDPSGSSPWAMQIVVHVPGENPPTSSDVCSAVAAATLQVIYDPRCDLAGGWHPAMSRWLEGRIRKIVRRAKGVKWDAVGDYGDGHTVTVGSATVRAFLPAPVDETPKVLSRLQISGLKLDDPKRIQKPPSEMEWPGITVAVSPHHDLEAHPGKAAAQVAHAGQVAAAMMSPQRRKAFADVGWPVTVIWCDNTGWEQFIKTAPVDIHDAGFTVVEAGAHTASAQWNDSLTQ